MPMVERIRKKLTDHLDPIRLEVVDDSQKHEGHAGWRQGGETHFRVTVVSAMFADKSRIERQRLVYGALAEELAAQIHALQMDTLTPDEDRGRAV